MSQMDHPCCDRCWEDLSEGNQHPLRETEGDLETCCFCGDETRSGIWASTWIIPVECQGHERKLDTPETSG